MYVFPASRAWEQGGLCERFLACLNDTDAVSLFASDPSRNGQLQTSLICELECSRRHSDSPHKDGTTFVFRDWKECLLEAKRNRIWQSNVKLLKTNILSSGYRQSQTLILRVLHIPRDGRRSKGTHPHTPARVLCALFFSTDRGMTDDLKALTRTTWGYTI